MHESCKGKSVRFQVNGVSHEGVGEESLLCSLRRYGYEVPSLCHHEAVSPYGACRLCLVEVRKGRKTKVTTSCNYPLLEGSEVFLDTPTVVRHRKTVLQLLLAMAPKAGAVREIAEQYGVTETPFEPNQDNDCILCGLCNRVCKEVVEADAIGFAGRGYKKTMSSPYDEVNDACIGCGACAVVCPTNCIGLKEENNIRTLEKWHRRLPMKMCKKCGLSFAPTFQLNHFAKAINKDPSFFDICVDCR